MKYAGIFLLGIFSIVAILAMSSPAKAEPYSQIKLFVMEKCEWVKNRLLPKELQSEKGGQWIKKKRRNKFTTTAPKMEICKGPIMAIDKANAWLKKKGNSILILSYQIHDDLGWATILWKDNKELDHKVDDSNPFLPTGPKKAKDKQEDEYEVQNPYK